jgi:hypothetical protein
VTSLMDQLEYSNLSKLYYRYENNNRVADLWVNFGWLYVTWDAPMSYASEPHGLIAMYEEDL